MSDKYEAIISQITVTPKGEAMYHESATRIKLEHEVGGETHFEQINIEQSDDGIRPGVVRIFRDDWPYIKAAVEYLLNGQHKQDAG